MTLNIHVFARQEEAQVMKDELDVLGWKVEMKSFDHVMLNDYLGNPKPKLIYDEKDQPLWVLLAIK